MPPIQFLGQPNRIGCEVHAAIIEDDGVALRHMKRLEPRLIRQDRRDDPSSTRAPRRFPVVSAPLSCRLDVFRNCVLCFDTVFLPKLHRGPS